MVSLQTAAFGPVLFELSDRLEQIDGELEATEKAGGKPRAELPAELADIAENLNFYASLALQNPDYATYGSYLASAAGDCDDASDKLAKIVKAGGVLGAGWGAALDDSVTFTALAAGALPY